MSEDIQCAGSVTRPPMFDRIDFESWQQRIRLYFLGKDNGENIMKSINEGPFHMGTVSDVIAGGTKGAVQQGPVRARVLNDLSAEEKERYKADIRATNILLQGETIQGYYVRFTKLINDMRNIKMTMPRMQLNSKFVNNMLPEWSRFITEVKLNRGLKESNFISAIMPILKQHEQYLTQSSKSPQSSNEPSPADNFQLDSGSSSTENLIESLSNSLALLTQSYKSHIPQTNNQLRTLSNARNKATVQDGERLWFKMSVEDTMRTIKENHFKKQCKKECYSWDRTSEQRRHY
ncbi:hypothetical protein Tco_0842525 [Tanacetum coccineum]|uniref:Integrase, catalytic region, zinc finger, CCHC-type, peptidase aspartic, catalytic n=1 Tax=Tanacetum coccineum TaxID=301880 RepID=A0ABQ5B0Q5_9ASTR